MSPVTGMARLAGVNFVVCSYEAFIWKNFHPGYRDLGRRNRDLGNRAGPPSHMNTSNFLQRK